MPGGFNGSLTVGFSAVAVLDGALSAVALDDGDAAAAVGDPLGGPRGVDGGMPDGVAAVRILLAVTVAGVLVPGVDGIGVRACGDIGAMTGAPAAALETSDAAASAGAAGEDDIALRIESRKLPGISRLSTPPRSWTTKFSSIDVLKVKPKRLATKLCCD